MSEEKLIQSYETLRQEYELKLSCLNLANQLNTTGAIESIDVGKVVSDAQKIYDWVTNGKQFGTN